MIEILKYLVERLPFLFRPGGFRFVDSEASESFNNAYVVLESGSLRLRFVRDRSQLFVEFQRVGKKSRKWYPMFLFRALLTGDLLGGSLLNSDSEEANAQWVEFLTRAIPDLEVRFADEEEAQRTLGGLRDITGRRAKELFR